MRTSFIDAALRRADKRPPTDSERREREERKLNVSQLVSEIAAPGGSSSRPARERRQRQMA